MRKFSIKISKKAASLGKMVSLSTKVAGLGVKMVGVFLMALLLSSVDATAQTTNLCNIDWYSSASSNDVSNAIRSGSNVNQSCPSSSSPLLLALEYGRADVILALIRAGANLDYQDPYTRQTPNQVITDQCDRGRIDRSVCNEVRRGFEARAEAHNNLCNPRWWQSFYRQSEAQAKSRMQAMMNTTGLDVNYDCGRGDRPLHIALQDSLTPLTIGVAWAIWIFIDEGRNVNFFARNNTGRSIMNLAEVRYDHQIKGNYVNLLRKLCNNQITGQEYNRQNSQHYQYELSAYKDIKQISGENSQAIVSRINMELFGISTPGPKSKEQLCLKYR